MTENKRMSAEMILCNTYHCVKDELQLAIALNCDKGLIIKAMEAYARQEQPQWVSVDERLPDEMQTVLIVNTANKVSTGYRSLGGFWFDTELDFSVNITHWQHLPPPPTPHP